MTATVTLGGVALSGMEVPGSIPFAGAQAVKVHKLVGGRRLIDAMGRDDRTIAWSGRFYEAGALGRAQTIDALRQAGTPVSLTWDALSYTVVIQSFEPDYEHPIHMPYRIACEIVTDNVTPIDGATTNQQSMTDQVNSDSSTVGNISSGLPTFPGQVAA